MSDDASAMPTTTLPESEEERSRVPVNVRNISLVVVAVLAGVYTLHWASAVFIPVLLGIMLSYALAPLIAQLQRWRIPRALSSAVVLLALVGGSAWIGVALTPQATNLISSLPDVAQKLRYALRDPPQRAKAPSPIDKVQKAAVELEKAADEASTASAPTTPRGATRVVIEKPKFNIQDYLVKGTLGLLAFAGQTVMVVLIAFFLLSAGDTFRRKMVKLSGDTLTQKKITVQVLDEITGQIQRYLMVQLYTSAMVGVATWLAFLAIGLKNAGVWGVVAGVTNLVPYLGAALVGGGSALVGFVQFGSLQMAMLVGGTSFVIHSIVAYLILPWLTSRSGNMNPVAVFVSVLAWGWLWGLPGLLLGVPIMMVVKAICDRIEDLKPVGELLGN